MSDQYEESNTIPTPFSLYNYPPPPFFDFPPPPFMPGPNYFPIPQYPLPHYPPPRQPQQPIPAPLRRETDRSERPKRPREPERQVEEEFVKLTPEEILENEKKTWTRCAPADLYYTRDLANSKLMYGTEKLKTIADRFKRDLIDRGRSARSAQPEFEYRRVKQRHVHSGGRCCPSDSSSSSDSSDDDDLEDDDLVLQELERKQQHPARLHAELWFNDLGEMNDGPLCRCRYSIHSIRIPIICLLIFFGEKL